MVVSVNMSVDIAEFVHTRWDDLPRPRTIKRYFDGVQLQNSTDSEQTWTAITKWWNRGMRIIPDKDSPDPWGPPLPSSRDNLPSRLLDLQGIPGHDDLRLTCAETDMREGLYMALSYRWRPDGERPTETYHWPWELTTMSIDQMRVRISFETLPRAFQDVITVVRKLNVRYLWIDAMCIIQDDNADWQLESSRMDSIYDVQAGLFGTRDPKQLLPLELDVSWVEGRFEPSGPTYLVEHKYMENQLSQSSLNSRGWVVQERNLSPRILHFLPDQVFWEDSESGYNACEVFPRGCVRLDDDYDRDRPRVGPVTRQYVDFQDTWEELIGIYSATSLTKSTDKMVALQGLAQHWSSHMPEDRYCAGLWQTTMPECLLWKLADGQYQTNSHSHPVDSRLPSWSWLSVNKTVRPYSLYRRHAPEEEEEVRYRAIILELNLEPEVPGHDFGQLKSGANIVIRGRLKSAKGVYWPMSSLNRSAQTADRSMIEACTMPLHFRKRLKCSIDDMPRFLAMWGNTAPSTIWAGNRIRWLLHYLICPCLVIFANLRSLVFRKGQMEWFNIFLTLIAGSIYLSIWHFTNLGSHGIYFLEIHTSKVFEEPEGLILLRRQDGTYRRLGTFKEPGKRTFFVDCEEQDVVIL